MAKSEKVEQPFLAVEFLSEKSLYVVPYTWVNEAEGTCFWPRGSGTSVLRKVEALENPDPTWKKFEIKVWKKCVSYAQAVSWISSLEKNPDGSEVEASQQRIDNSSSQQKQQQNRHKSSLTKPSRRSKKVHKSYDFSDGVESDSELDRRPFSSKPTKLCCVGLSLIVGVGCIVTGVLVILYFQDLIDAFIKSELPLRKGSEPFELWRKPPVTPLLKVWFFNITNSEDFLKNGTKLRVQEIGPYVYSEKWEKVGVEWHPNGTLSYRQTKQFFFEPSLSRGAENDTFLIPNVPVLSAVGQMSTATRIVKKAIATLLDILKLEPFTSHSVKELMWGYDDPLIKLGKQVLPEGKRVPYDKFGFFVDKNNTESKVFTVFSGEADLQDFAAIDVYDGKKKLEFWKTDACNMLNGTDATGFPSPLTNESDIYVFNQDLCRSLHLKYNATVHHQGLPAFRFMPAAETFGDVETYPENMCYCLDGPPCSRRGLFNISVCQFGAPIFISFPHFLHGDPSLLNEVDGLNPNPMRHQFYIDVQPKLGIAMQAKGRVQINIQMNKVVEIPQTANLSDVLIPILWFEDGIDELPPKITGLISQAVHTPAIAKSALSYVTFILGGLLLACGVMYLIRGSASKKESMATNGHANGDMEKSTNGVKNGPLKSHQYSNAMVELDDKLKNGNGKESMGVPVIEAARNTKSGESDL